MMNVRAMHKGEGDEHSSLGMPIESRLSEIYLGHACSAFGEDGTKLTLCDARGKQLAMIRRRCNYGQHQSPLPPSLAKCLWSSL